jgi:hypothetical protein
MINRYYTPTTCRWTRTCLRPGIPTTDKFLSADLGPPGPTILEPDLWVAWLDPQNDD